MNNEPHGRLYLETNFLNTIKLNVSDHCFFLTNFWQNRTIEYGNLKHLKLKK